MDLQIRIFLFFVLNPWMIFSQKNMVTIPETNIYASDIAIVPFIAKEDLTMYGIAGTIIFDVQHLTFEVIHSRFLSELSIQHLNLLNRENGRISFIYLNSKGENIEVPKDSVIFYLTFRFNSVICLDSSLISMSNLDVPWEIVRFDESVVRSELPTLAEARIRSACPISFYKVDSLVPDCYESRNGRIRVFVEGGFPPYEYQWNTGADDPEVGDLSGGDYRITVTDRFNNQVTRQIHLPGAVPLEFQIDAHPAICGLENGQVQIQSDYRENLTIDWFDVEEDSLWLLENLGEGIYHFTMSNQTGCVKDTYAIIDNIGLEVPQLEDTVRLCKDERVKVSPPFGEIDVSWLSSGEFIEINSNEFTPDSSGIYEVRYGYQDQCYESKPIFIEIDDPIFPEFKDTIVPKGSFLAFRLETDDQITWSSDEFYLHCSHCHQIDFVVDKKGFLSVETITANGCRSDHTIFIDLFEAQLSIANVVTPNADGINDKIFLDLPGMQLNRILLFNSFGTFIDKYPSIEDLNDWIGGRQGAAGSYYYVMELTNESGKITCHYGDLNIVY